jgi:hypothetical protein
MKQRGTCLAVLGLLLALAGPAPGAAAAARPGAVEVDAVKLTATVEAIDTDKRTVTVKGPAGRSTTLTVGKAVKNFDQIQVGDKVAAEYVDATAVFVRKAGAPPQATEAVAVELAPKGQKPAGLAVETTELTATVENINYDLRLVTLRGPAGNARTLKVAPRVESLRQVKVGDELVVRHTEALAITVLKPAP